MTEPIVKSVELDCAAEDAFAVFVDRISIWWPLETHAVSVAAGKPARQVTIEPEVGGAVYETMWDGARADWGQVLEFEPGSKFAMTWHPGDPAEQSTRVDVLFEDLVDCRSRVTLTHSGWDALGETATARRRSYTQGWQAILEKRFAKAWVSV